MQRANAGDNHDCWPLLFDWRKEYQTIKQQLRDGTYRLSPMKQVTIDDQALDIFTSRDAIVSKALSLVLNQYWSFSPLCTHVKDHGGAKQTVEGLKAELPNYKFVYLSAVHH